MNANELADELDDCGKFFEDRLYKEAATMLRQQQEKLTKYELRNEEQRNRITHLEAHLEREKEMNKQEKIKELEYLNNEHRGVIGILMDEREVLRAEIEKLKSEVVSYRTDAEKLTMRLIDLSVSPPIKKLTDNEKWKLWGECPNGLVYDRVMLFADLILRKAQEK